MAGVYHHLLEWSSARRAELSVQELSGSLGDLGTFLPLTVALAQEVQLDIGITLICTGIYNIVSGM